MNRLSLLFVLLVMGTPAFAQSGPLRITSTGNVDVPNQVSAQPGLRLYVLKVVNGFVPAYDFQGNVIEGANIEYVLADRYGRQRAAIGKGIGDPDHKISVVYYEGYINANEVTRFALARTGKTNNGNVAAVRPPEADAPANVEPEMHNMPAPVPDALQSDTL